jgi:glycosyltransferase involved in cell wall biosynthesis
MKNPKISVIMPVYNGIQYLEEAIRSILGQTYSDFEFIIINDASSEDVGAVVQSFGDSRIVYVENEQNIGLTKSLNKCLDLASGQVLARQDGDDVSEPTRFEKQLPMFQEEGVGLVVSHGCLIDHKGNKLPYGDYIGKQIRLAPAAIPKTLQRGNCILGGSAMFSREVFETIGYYDEVMYLAQDYNYWLRLTQHFTCQVVPEELYRHRQHNDKVSDRLRKSWPYSKKLNLAKARAASHPIIKENKA